MFNRKQLVTALTLTIIVTLVVAVSTEGVRQFMQFDWQIDEGDEFMYDVSVIGYYRTPSTNLPLSLGLLNHTQVKVKIISLRNTSLFSNPSNFEETVIEHEKTNTTFANGTPIAAVSYHTINSLASQCFLPVGSWSVLGSFYPNQFERPDNVTTRVESYFSYRFHDFFILGYVSYSESSESGWFGYISPETGVPTNMTAWGWSSTSLAEISYVMTLTSVQ